MSIKLNKENLENLKYKGIKTPNYNQDELSAGIIHFGVGNFHRSHQVIYLNELFNEGLDKNWAIIGAGVMSNDERMREILEEQNFLSSVVEQTANSNSIEVTGVMIDYLSPNDKQVIIDKLSDESIKIVSLTITEGGYFIDSSTGLFDVKHPAIIEDSKDPENPKTVFGLILSALLKRYEKKIEPFTIVSCDNIPHNGNVTKNTLSGLAKLSNEVFAKWIIDNVSFPNGMVDRITPATTPRERKLVKELYGLEDEAVVFSEKFKQWVLEDKFPSGRPALEKVGVQFVDDVAPYEHMKIRILNGGHALIAYLAALLDIEFAHEAMENDLVLKFFQKVQENEIIPILPPVPNTDLTHYYKKIEERFSNPKIADTTLRLCYDGSNRQPKFIIPSVLDCLDKGIDIHGLALGCALWCRYCYGETVSGKIIEANDPKWDVLNQKAKKAKDNPLVWLEMEDIYGEVGKSELFSEKFSLALKSIFSNGIEKTVQEYIDIR
jgi:mannitol 2-dehydrogenase